MIILEFIANGLVTGAIYGMVALGFALVYNTTRIFHIAYAVLYMFAPYMLLTFHKYLSWPFYMAFFASILLTVLLSLAIEEFVYQPLHRIDSSGGVVMISSIGVMIVVINVVAIFYGNETKILDDGIPQTVSFGGVVLTEVQLWQFCISAAMIGVFLFVLKHSKFGTKTRAIRDNEVLSLVFSLNVRKIRRVLFGLSAVFLRSCRKFGVL